MKKSKFSFILPEGKIKKLIYLKNISNIYILTKNVIDALFGYKLS